MILVLSFFSLIRKVTIIIKAVMKFAKISVRSAKNFETPIVGHYRRAFQRF
ncbi:hypothetical protein MYP_3052 [Sporocytophaga myxococcoides]|uniref:Uncharacterized protein n=1 Tax=Sporocytophaga myxococcoides TaxID=153721 RepID=A0A098LIC9_9BACT|nr:hypothetical protein MYP_3052 [Sporocytophaga myxococcoides]